MTRAFFDLETIPTTRGDVMVRILEDLAAHNKTLKKPHSEEHLLALAEEEHAKTALDGAFGEIVVIGTALDDGPVCSWSRDPRSESEASLLQRFRDDMHDALDGRGALLTGHNVVGFDMPFLRQRSLVCGVSLPAWMTRSLKPWEAVDVDTMLAWSGGSTQHRISLDKLCRAFGIAGKVGDIDGSNIWAAILAGRLADVVAYCERDVVITRECWRRLNAAAGEVRQ